MAITFSIYSNANAVSRSVSVDFAADILAASSKAITDQTQYYFKFTTGASDIDGLKYTPRVVTDLSDLALNKEKQSSVDDANPYANVTAMVADYLYDYIYGHTEAQFSTNVHAKSAMRF